MLNTKDIDQSKANETVAAVIGMDIVRYEQALFNYARDFSKDYDSGYWPWTEVGDSFLMLMHGDELYTIETADKGKIELNAKFYSIAVNLVVLSRMYSAATDTERANWYAVQHEALKGMIDDLAVDESTTSQAETLKTYL
ncbi:hypothetical protein [Vibrio barjaei]|uniref:hypothetical protein n=1 Tax=Vibrio barjaei TaxID=1676683 RepID=UPI0022848693|nr:hypothetical protein [Vibrio barjaei]MCY9870476.1 hypothetical protein [Vibrio barjaei]